jgi:hypothetical protein
VLRAPYQLTGMVIRVSGVAALTKSRSSPHDAADTREDASALLVSTREDASHTSALHVSTAQDAERSMSDGAG